MERVPELLDDTGRALLDKVYKELAILGLLSFLTFISEVRAGMRPHILPVRMSTTIRSRRTVAPVCGLTRGSCVLGCR